MHSFTFSIRGFAIGRTNSLVFLHVNISVQYSRSLGWVQRVVRRRRIFLHCRMTLTQFSIGRHLAIVFQVNEGKKRRRKRRGGVRGFTTLYFYFSQSSSAISNSDHLPSFKVPGNHMSGRPTEATQTLYIILDDATPNNPAFYKSALKSRILFINSVHRPFPISPMEVDIGFIFYTFIESLIYKVGISLFIVFPIQI